MPSYSEISNTLTEHLRLTQPPIAVCLADSVPGGVESMVRPQPRRMPLLAGSRSRVFATSATNHSPCAIGQYTHNLDMSPASGGSPGRPEGLRGFELRARTGPANDPRTRSKPKYVVYGPLAAIPLDPDVVLLFVRADQTLILSEASQQLENGLPPAMGRPRAPSSRRPRIRAVRR